MNLAGFMNSVTPGSIGAGERGIAFRTCVTHCTAKSARDGNEGLAALYSYD
jgi:hypothetical protein